MKKKTSKITLNAGENKTKLIASISAINDGQKNMLRQIAEPSNHVILVDGIAGTGKTFCAVSWGVEQFFKGKFKKLVFSRPIVEAGERLGYLPMETSIRR